MARAYTAFFDANIFFGASLRSLIMELAQSKSFRARWSQDVHREWINSVAEKRGIDLAILANTQAQMDAAVPDCLVTGYESLIAGLSLPDPDDWHVLAAAIKVRASVIVTFNLADFPAGTLEKYRLAALHPDEFLLGLEKSTTGVLVEAAIQDRAHYRNPPKSWADYLQALRRAGVTATADFLAGRDLP